MDDPRQKHGNHTWDRVLYYYRCPKCGYIIENRDKYEPQLGVLQKEMICNRCQKSFTVTKKNRPTFGPLFNQD
jgi:DNA-directed RNA polymerase subunit RPC12/RpoP